MSHAVDGQLHIIWVALIVLLHAAINSIIVIALINAIFSISPVKTKHIFMNCLTEVSWRNSQFDIQYVSAWACSSSFLLLQDLHTIAIEGFNCYFNTVQSYNFDHCVIKIMAGTGPSNALIIACIARSSLCMQHSDPYRPCPFWDKKPKKQTAPNLPNFTGFFYSP